MMAKEYDTNNETKSDQMDFGENRKEKINRTNKWICALAYIIFFVPILVDANNDDYKFHTNQGLNLFLLFVASNIVGSFVPVIGWFILLPVGSIMAFILCVIGIINSFNEKTKDLPVIGKYRLIK